MSRSGDRPDAAWNSLWTSVDAAAGEGEAGDASGRAKAGPPDLPAPRLIAAPRAQASQPGEPAPPARDSVAPAHRAPLPAGALTLIVRTDGAARGNPGPASLGAVLIDASAAGSRRPDARPIASISEFLGTQTNNVAEYTAVVRALALAEELGAAAVEMLLDSKLIVEQLNGRWRVKDAKLIPLHADIRARLARFSRWSAAHVPRAQNKQADALCNDAIDRVAVGGSRAVVIKPS